MRDRTYLGYTQIIDKTAQFLQQLINMNIQVLQYNNIVSLVNSLLEIYPKKLNLNSEFSVYNIFRELY